MFFIFSALAPIFLVMLAGFVVERMGILPATTGSVLSVFSINISIPCLIFHIMAGTDLNQLSQGGWWTAMLSTQLGGLALFYWMERKFRRAPSGPAIISSLSICFCNAGFVGLSVIINLFPGNREAMAAAGLTVVASNAVAIVAQMVLMAWERKRRAEEGEAPAGEDPEPTGGKRLWTLFRRFILGNPILMATALGLTVAVLQIPVWKPLDRACELLGFVSPSCMLFALGFCLRANLVEGRTAGGNSVGHQVWLCFMRMVGLPLITLAALVLMGSDPMWTSVAVIIMSTGTAILVAAFGQVYRAAAGQAALTVAITNSLSLFSLMGFIWLLGKLGLIPAGAL